MARETKAQLRQRIDDLKTKLREAEQRAEAVEGNVVDDEELETARRERDVAKGAERKLKRELEATRDHVRGLDRELAEAMAELVTSQDRVAALEAEEGRGDPSHARDGGHDERIEELQEQLEEARDQADCKQWEVDQLRKDSELETMRAKERVRGELQAVHAQELQARDDLVQLLKARVAELERRPALDNGHRGSGQVAKVSQSGGQVSGRGSSQSPGGEDEHQALLTSVPEEGNSEIPVRKLTLPPLPKFTGEKAEEDAFERWTRRLLRHAELEKWTDRERLLQLEIHLAGRAEQVYELWQPSP